MNLRLEDEPLAYQPALGGRVSFRLSYRQRDSIDEDTNVFGVGSNWTTSFRAFIAGSSGNGVYLHRGGAFWIYHAPGYPEPRSGSLVSSITSGYQIEKTDGSVDSYTLLFTNSVRDVLYFLTAQSDPAGNTTTYSYSTNGSGALLLVAVTDPNGLATHVYYDNTSFPTRITRVVDPFSRVNYLSYDSQGYLTNTTDVAGLATSFMYDSSAIKRGWITSMTTPYGTTSFAYGGNNALTDDWWSSEGVNRYVLITLPTGGKHLCLYQQDCTNFLSEWTPTIPDTSALGGNMFNTWEQLQAANSFYWGPLQYGLLSTTDPMSLAASDYFKGRLRHWLGGDGNGPGAAMGLERAPSPDGTTMGQCTWYDYDGQGAPDSEGSSDFPRFTAQVLPDGTTNFTWLQRGAHFNVLTDVSTYSTPAGLVGLRTNSYYYADNAIDLLQWAGPNGEQVLSNYFATGNTIHKPDASYDALNQATLYTYNGYGQLTSAITPAGLTSTNLYFASGSAVNRLSTTIDLEIQRTNACTYYANGLLLTQTDERGLVTTNYWDNLQRLTGMGYPDGTTTSNLYLYLDVAGVKDRLGNWNNYGYNAIRQKVAESNAKGVITAYNYCQCGLLYSVTNAWGTPVQVVTSYGYDYQGNRVYTYLPDATLTNWFDSLGRVTTACDAWGCHWFGYNNQGLLIGRTNAFGTEQHTVFDIEDRAIYVTDANAVTVTNSYDLLGRLFTRTYPDGGVEGFGYSARGLAAYTNQLGFTNLYAYDAALRKTSETNANGEILRYTDDAGGDLLSLTDGKNQTTRWKYDVYGRMTNKLDQAGTEILRYQYDADSRLTNRWSLEKGSTVYAYDNVGNLVNIAYRVDPAVAFQYDALNRLTNMIDGVGTNRYTYTSGGFLLTEGGLFANDTVTNSYSSRLRTGFSLAQPTGVWTNGFTYDAAKRLSNVISPAGVFRYTYDPVRLMLPVNLSLPNTGYITNRYDLVARLLTTKLNNWSGTTLDSALYGYNAGSQRTTFTNAAGTHVNYTYDPIGQLKIGASSVSSENRGYAYDAAWNLNTRTNNGVATSFGVNGLNELTSVGSSTTFGYDGNGNLTNKAVGGAHPLTYIYTFDDESRLAGVQTNNSTGPIGLTTFVYDGLGRLREQLQWTYSSGAGGGGGASAIRRTVSIDSSGSGWNLSGGTLYIYDGRRVIQERDAIYNNPLVSYTRGNDLSGRLEGAGGIGGLLARSDGYASGSFTSHNFYHADGNGNITYLVNSGQTLAASYRYDPFGNLTSSSGTLASTNSYRFSGKEFMTSVGLYYYLYRFYDPSTQRWLNRDPIGEAGGLNLYAYVGNSPVNFVDPFGLERGDIYDPDLGNGTAFASYLYDKDTKKQLDKVICEGNKKLKHAAKNAAKEIVKQALIFALTDGMGQLAESVSAVTTGFRATAEAVDLTADALASSAEGGGVQIFRAVDQNELPSVLNGTYGSSPSMGGKYFSLTQEGAQNFGGSSINAGQQMTITSTTVPQSVFNQGFLFNDVGAQGAGASVHFSQDFLPTLYNSMTPITIH